jgi:GNAT superfamily N-acetyltransferase
VKVIETRNRDVSAEGGVDTVQRADIVLPRRELDRIWSPEYLERLARTYWRWIERVSVGLLRILYTATAREVVLLRRPFVLLRFLAPEYDVDERGGTVTWRIDRGLLVAPAGRGQGFLRMTVERHEERPETGEVTARITSQVSNFYPTIRGRGWFSRVGRFVYRFTQLKIHVLVTNAFLRSLANLELAPSVVGSLQGRTPGVPDDEEFAALRRLQEGRRNERGAGESGEPSGSAATVAAPGSGP